MQEPYIIYHFHMILVTMVHLFTQISQIFFKHPCKFWLVISFKSSLKSDVDMVDSLQTIVEQAQCNT